MESKQTLDKDLEVRISLAANPAVNFVKGTGNTTPLNPEGFTLLVEMGLQYASLSHILNGYLQGKRFQISEGLINSYVVVQQVAVSAGNSGNLFITVTFAGSFNGTVRLTGKPIYHLATNSISVPDLAYDLETKNLLLNAAKWLFNRKIEEELSRRTVISLLPYLEKIKLTVEEGLNKSWRQGVRGEGSVSDFSIDTIETRPDILHMAFRCTGKLAIWINEDVLFSQSGAR